jgi:hypothetical protein
MVFKETQVSSNKNRKHPELTACALKGSICGVEAGTKSFCMSPGLGDVFHDPTKVGLGTAYTSYTYATMHA